LQNVDTAGLRIDDPAQWHLIIPDSLSTIESENERTRTSDLAQEVERHAQEHRATVVLNKTRYDLIFPSAVQREMELRTLAEWVIRPRLRKSPGVAQVVAMGGGLKQYQVLVDPVLLRQEGVTLKEVEEALRQTNLNTSGGTVVTQGKQIPIHIQGRLPQDPERVLATLRELPVKRSEASTTNGLTMNSGNRSGSITFQRTVVLDQVAQVVERPRIKLGDASVNGRPAVILMVSKQPHVDTRTLTADVVAGLAEIKTSLPPYIEMNPELFQLKGFIDRGIYNVGEALVLGALLVLVVLFLFLLNFRTTFITLTAIPLSLAVTALVFKWIGSLTGTQLAINVMTLGGLAIAMGELVDDAIVDVENIFRRLRENNAAANPQPILQVIYEASVEIRSAIVFGTLMVILVFIPLFALSGLEGRLFTPLGVAYIVSILASLLVSLTVTPVLSYYLLPQARATHRRADSPLLRLLKWGAAGLIRFSMARPGMILVLSWVVVGGCAWLLTQRGTAFLPKFDEGSVQVNVTLPPGSALEATNEVASRIDVKFRAMQARGDVLHFSRRSGRAELDEHVAGPYFSEYWLILNPVSGRRREEILHEIQDDLNERVPDAQIEAEQPLQHLISHMLSGVAADVAIKVYGDDLDSLRRVAEDIQGTLSNPPIPGIASIVVEPQQYIEEIHIRHNPDKLKQLNVSWEPVAGFLQTALQGEVVSQVLEGQRRFDLLLRVDQRYRDDYHTLREMLVELPDERRVRLEDVADVDTASIGISSVSRENIRRRIVIRCNLLGRDQGSVVAAIRQRVQRVAMPEGYFPEIEGQFESQRRATMVISVLAVVSFLGMFVILYMLYPSTRIVLQLLNALPMAFIGGVLALVVTDQSLSVASLVGFISLGGIAARNGILLVSHYFHLMKYEGEGFTPHMILRGGLERLAPVLMTALTAGIALVPLVIGGLQPGREILYPVATVILGGLITSTLCEYLIHPGLFWRFSGKDAERVAGATGDSMGE
jgi:HME family heavy-metal exporter